MVSASGDYRDGQSAIRWPRRIPKSLIRRLYASVPSGRLDEKLLDEVGISLYMRCRAILTISRARQGEVLCPVCDRAGEEIYIRRLARSPEEVVRCTHCGWQIAWADYMRTYQRKQFNEGGAGAGIRRFMEAYPKCSTAWEKMLSIDLLIHEFHFSLRSDPDRPTRAACVNLIEGKLSDVVACLDEISGLSANRPEMATTHVTWKANCVKAGNWHPK